MSTWVVVLVSEIGSMFAAFECDKSAIMPTDPFTGSALLDRARKIKLFLIARPLVEVAPVKGLSIDLYPHNSRRGTTGELERNAVRRWCFGRQRNSRRARKFWRRFRRMYFQRLSRILIAARHYLNAAHQCEPFSKRNIVGRKSPCDRYPRNKAENGFNVAIPRFPFRLQYSKEHATVE